MHLLTLALATLLFPLGLASAVHSVPCATPAKLPDAAELLSPSATRLGGGLGDRLTANETHRLLQVDEEALQELWDGRQDDRGRGDSRDDPGRSPGG